MYTNYSWPVFDTEEWNTGIFSLAEVFPSLNGAPPQDECLVVCARVAQCCQGLLDCLHKPIPSLERAIIPFEEWAQLCDLGVQVHTSAPQLLGIGYPAEIIHLRGLHVHLFELRGLVEIDLHISSILCVLMG